MAAIDYLREQGLSARIRGERIIVSPRSGVTESIRQFIRLHRLELLAELAANDGQERRCHWQITRNGTPLCTMVGEPITYSEARAEACWRWPDAEIHE